MRCKPTSAPTRGRSHQISEGTHGHACRLSGGRLVSGRRGYLRDDTHDSETVGGGRPGGSGRRGRIAGRGGPQLRRRGRAGRGERGADQGPDHGQAAPACGRRGWLWRLGPELPPACRRRQGDVAVQEPSGPASGGVGAGRRCGLRLGRDRPAVRVLRGAGMVEIPVRRLRRQLGGGSDHGRPGPSASRPSAGCPEWR